MPNHGTRGAHIEQSHRQHAPKQLQREKTKARLTRAVARVRAIVLIFSPGRASRRDETLPRKFDRSRPIEFQSSCTRIQHSVLSVAVIPCRGRELRAPRRLVHGVNKVERYFVPPRNYSAVANVMRRTRMASFNQTIVTCRYRTCTKIRILTDYTRETLSDRSIPRSGMIKYILQYFILFSVLSRSAWK